MPLPIPFAARRFLPLWIAFVLLAVVAVRVGLAWQRPQHRAYDDWGLYELTTHMQTKLPELQLAHLYKRGNCVAGTYICGKNSDRESVKRSLHHHQVSGEWRGVLFVDTLAPIPHGLIPQDDKYGFVIGRLWVFGDPAMMNRLQQSLP